MIEPYFSNENIKLYKGDCLEILPTHDIKFEMCLTDPPYYKVVNESWDIKFENKTNFLIWYREVVESIFNVLNSNSSLYVFTGRQMNRHIACILDDYMEENRIIIWERKRLFNNTRGKSLSSGYEDRKSVV